MATNEKNSITASEAAGILCVFGFLARQKDIGRLALDCDGFPTIDSNGRIDRHELEAWARSQVSIMSDKNNLYICPLGYHAGFRLETKKPTDRKLKMCKKLAELSKEGNTLKACGDAVGISAERVRQLLYWWGMYTFTMDNPQLLTQPKK